MLLSLPGTNSVIRLINMDEPVLILYATQTGSAQVCRRQLHSVRWLGSLGFDGVAIACAAPCSQAPELRAVHHGAWSSRCPHTRPHRTSPNV
jgi:hypothetical protein